MSENQSSLELTLASSPDLLKEIEDAYHDIPFGNTRFQTEAFILGSTITPMRAYRAIGLQLHSILTTLRDHQQRLELAAIDEEELRFTIEDPNTNQFDRKRAEIKLKHMTSSNPWNQKLLNDTMREAEVLYKHFKALPKFTREQFEAGESLYFGEKLKREIVGITGARESLVSMNEGITSLRAFEDKVKGVNDPALVWKVISDTVQLLQIKEEPSGPSGVSSSPPEPNGALS